MICKRRKLALAAKRLILSFMMAGLCSCSYLFFLPGVADRNQEVERFIGRPASELIRHYGQPYAVKYDSQGRKILVFVWTTEYTEQEEGRIWTDSFGVTHYTQPTSNTVTNREQRSFTIDKDGKVIKGKWRF